MPAHTKGTHISLRKRLASPADLSDEAREIFKAVVSAVDPTHFSAVDLPLLEQYASAAATARIAQRAIDLDGAVVDGRASAWVTVLEKSSRSCVALAARLRVCPQSRFDRLVAGSNSRPQPDIQRPWEFNGEGDADDLLAT